MEHSLYDLITMLDDVIRKAKPIPLSKNSAVDVAQIDEIATEMRLVLPNEIKQAQNVVSDKNRIISQAKAEAEEIIRNAEKKKAELLNETAILKEARQRAAEEISKAQKHSNQIRTSTNEYVGNLLGRIDELLTKDINNIRLMRKTLSQNSNIQAAPQQAQQKPKQN